MRFRGQRIPDVRLMVVYTFVPQADPIGISVAYLAAQRRGARCGGSIAKSKQRVDPSLMPTVLMALAMFRLNQSEGSCSRNMVMRATKPPVSLKVTSNDPGLFSMIQPERVNGAPNALLPRTASRPIDRRWPPTPAPMPAAFPAPSARSSTPSTATDAFGIERCVFFGYAGFGNGPPTPPRGVPRVDDAAAGNPRRSSSASCLV